MANRMLKDTLFTSETISALSDFDYRIWTALILLADDAGRGDARGAIVKGKAFPLRERLTNKDVDDAINRLAGNGCIVLYTVDGKSYYYFPKWNEHQRIRNSKPKYPAPEDGLRQIAANCGELPQAAANCGYKPTITRTIESNSKPTLNQL